VVTSALDRRHRRKKLLASAAPNAIRNLSRGLRELLCSALLERLAIQLDVFLNLPANHRFIAQHLNRVQQFTVLIGQEMRIPTEEPHGDLGVVFLGANVELQLRELQQLPVPLSNRSRRG